GSWGTEALTRAEALPQGERTKISIENRQVSDAILTSCFLRWWQGDVFWDRQQDRFLT
ncbi:MAG: hypothetical protein M1830_006607, partial [Pleopsidium flavum]